MNKRVYFGSIFLNFYSYIHCLVYAATCSRLLVLCLRSFLLVHVRFCKSTLHKPNVSTTVSLYLFRVKKRKMKRIIEEDSEDAHVLSQVKKQTKLNSSKSLNTNLPKSMSNGTPSQVDGIKSCESSIKTEKLESKVFSPQQGNILSQDSVEHQYDTSNLDNGIVNKKDLIARDLINELNMTQATPVGSSAGSSSMTVKTEVTPKDSRKETEAPSSPPNLPENLPLILEAGIQNLKDAAANCQNGKCRFFDASVNKTLLG